MDKSDTAAILDGTPPHKHGMSLAFEAVVSCAPRQDLGMGPKGHRFIVPITGGRFRGPAAQPEFHGEVIAGGADRQLLRSDGIKELSAIYEIRCHDGTVIGINNQVIVDMQAPERYAVSRVRFDAPEGKWAWLNRRFYLGSVQSQQPNPGYVIIRAFDVDCLYP